MRVKLSTEDVRNRREEYCCSLQEARRVLFLRQLELNIIAAENIEDIKDCLLDLLGDVP